jgi:hypothetical protein
LRQRSAALRRIEEQKNAPSRTKNRKGLYPGSTASNPLPAGAFAL